MKAKVIAGLFAWFVSILVTGAHTNDYHVLVFSKTTGFRHDSIPAALTAIRQLGSNNNFQVDATEDASAFTATNLQQYKAVIFLMTTGDVLDSAQQAAFEGFIRAGNGYVGIHSASDTEYSWPWYGGLVGAYFSSHPANQTATIKVADHVHPSTSHLPYNWVRFDEWYNFRINPRGNVHVLATLDEKTYAGGSMGFDHPIVWSQEYDGGRSWYTAGGHTSASYTEPLFVRHLLGGIQFAAGVVAADSGATLDRNFQKVVLDPAPSNPMELSVAPDGRVFYVERGGRVKIWKPQDGSIVVAGELSVFTQLEDGLIGITLDPGFATNNWLYLFYSPVSEVEQRIARFTMVGDSLDLTSEKILLEVPVQREQCCHSGGSMTFGPDGSLFVALGDNTNPFDSQGYAPIDERPGRSPWDAQKSSANANDLRGKILRIKPQANGSYTIPSGNLFPSGTPNTRPEIYIMGNRNPFRIAVDSETGWLYWGEVGPDAGGTNALRGPAGHDEWNQARTAGNYGWPYFTGNNMAYRDTNFATATVGAFYNPAAPFNDSPNNTGLQSLPAARSAWIWYPYSSSTQFPEVNGGSGRTAMGGPVYHFNPNLASNRKLPAYYDDTVFIYEWSRNYIKEVKLDTNGNILKINPFLPSFSFKRPMEMEIGPDGAIYMIEWGTGFGGNNPDAKVIRIDYVGGNKFPVAMAQVQPNNGSTPLTVQFSSAGTFDPDAGDTLTFAWSFFGDGATNSTLPNPSFTYSTPGNYTARLTVTDSFGSRSTVNLPISVGNTRPLVQILNPPNGAVFDWGETISYEITVGDVEDGSTASGQISCNAVSLEVLLGHDDHAHGAGLATNCTGFFAAPNTSDPDTELLFTVLNARYTDRGAPGVLPLEGLATTLLNPRRKQAEHANTNSGVTVMPTTDPDGGLNDVGAIDAGDFIGFFPVHLTNITALKVRVRVNLGASISIHADSASGPVLGSTTVSPSSDYQTITIPVIDPGRTHTLVVSFAAPTGGTDLLRLNWIEFVGNGASLNQTPLSGMAAPIPGRIEFENFDQGGPGVAYLDTTTGNSGGAYRSEDVDIAASSDSSGTFDVVAVTPGEWLEYTVDIATAGLYRLSVRVKEQAGTFHFELDGTDITGPLTPNPLAAPGAYQTMTKSAVLLPEGVHVLRVSIDNATGSTSIGLNFFELMLERSNALPSVSISTPPAGASYSAPGNFAVTALANDTDGSIRRVEFFANSVSLGFDTNAPFSTTVTNLVAGNYSLTAAATDDLGSTTISAAVQVSVVTTNAPFNAVAANIPGTIQAEDFDHGGEAIAYHDTDPGNNGNQYRQTGVDIEATSDAGGGFNVGWTAATEWLKYTVNATIDGIYTVEFRVASSGNGGAFHLEIDGINRSGALTNTTTGGWQTFRTLAVTNVPISAGRHTLRLALDSNGATGGVGNYNWLRFVATATNTPTYVLQSASSINAAFIDQLGSPIISNGFQFTAPITSSNRFFRVRSTVPSRIDSIIRSGTNVIIRAQ